MIHPVQTVNIQAVNVGGIFPMQGRATLATVHAISRDATWGTAVFTPKWGNDPAGPFLAFASTEVSASTFGPATAAGLSWVNMQGKGYLYLEVTTAEGGAVTSPEYVDLVVCDDQ